MTVNQLIAELQRVVAEKPERGEFKVEDQQRTDIGWIRRGSETDDRNRVVALLPEVDW